ncbi:CGBP1 protein, partial [Polyodon spathula]|nr:CGBP1 protein [Polyodon spathula]
MPKTKQITPKDWTNEFGKHKFHVDGNVLFCTSCNKAVNHTHSSTNEKRAIKTLKQTTVSGSFQHLTTAKEKRETVSDFVKMWVKADIPLYKVDQPAVGGAIPKSDQLN